MGPVNYRPLKQLRSPGLIVEPPKHRTSIARISMAILAQLRIVEKLLRPKRMGIPDTGYMGPKLDNDPRYGRFCGTSQLAKTLAVYDRSDPGAARAIIMAESDIEGTSPKLFWPEAPSVSASWSGIEPNVDTDGGYKIGDAVCARAVAIRGDE